MSDGPRPYRSRLRDDQARATRRRIVDAARELFVEQGYARTTIDAIAARAGVSRKTVFTAVGGKVEMLKLAWDWTLAGDDEPVAMADRPAMVALRALTDPGAVIAAWVRFNTPIAIRLARLYDVLVVAADGDADAAALHAVVEQQRTLAAQHLVDKLVATGGLRPELPRDRADSIAALFLDPVSARRCVLEAGWTPEEYEAYLDRQMRAALLP
jgi:AcrR family transcriptional regulator